MAKLYKAKGGFSYPSDADALKKCTAALKIEDEEKRHVALAAIPRTEAKKGDKLEPYSDEILKSWLDNDCVEEVSR